MFENYVFQLLKKEYGYCSIVEQVRLESGSVPVFVIVCGRIVVATDAKAKELLKKSGIGQVIECLLELDGDSTTLYVAEFTEITYTIRDYASLNAVNIEYADWRLNPYDYTNSL